MKNHWIVSPQSDQARILAKETRLHPAILSILLRRGLNGAGQIQRFLQPDLEDLEKPRRFRQMDKAVKRIMFAVDEKQKILLYGDYDADGITSTAILYAYLRQIGADCEVYIPNRFTDGYGLNLKTVEKLAKKKYALWICLDNGINAKREVDYLNSQSADTIVLDHHLPQSEDLPEAYCILNPKIETHLTESQPLASCGIVFKLVWALSDSLEKARTYLDLVAIGTIADVAPVLGDNRILLKFGLESLRQTKRPGLLSLIQQSKVLPVFLSSTDVAFSLAPKINASGRLGSPEEAFRLLVTENTLEAANLANILEQGNQQRQRVEQVAYDEAVEQIEENPAHAHQKILVVDHPDWHEGVLGIVAARLVDRYQKPAIVIRINQGEGKGSARSTGDLSLFDCLQSCKELLSAYGGHAQAAGLTIRQSNLSAFRQRINEVAAQAKTTQTKADELFIDAELSLAEISAAFLEQLSKLEPFGTDHPKPLFLSKDLRLKGRVNKRGQDTLQTWVSDRDGKTTCEVIAFRRFNRWQHLDRQAEQLSIVYRPSMRHYNGIASFLLELEDWC